jgi:hypothetical protein
MIPRFRVRDVLHAMFWMAIWGACWVSFDPHSADRDKLIALWLVLWAAPCAAVGAMFKHAGAGLLIGSALALLIGLSLPSR